MQFIRKPDPEIVRAQRSIEVVAELFDAPETGNSYLTSRRRRMWNKTAGLALAVPAVPLSLLSQLAVLVCEGAPSTIQMTRTGEAGQEFQQHKVRSMKRGEECHPVPNVDKTPNDPRITKIGHFLREHSLDETPQVLRNIVLRGDMMAVGPRPVAPEQLWRFEKSAGSEYYYTDWLNNAYTIGPPGLTGLAQINGRGNLEQDGAGRKQRMELDLEWSEFACIAYDSLILLRTPHAVLSKDGAF